MTDISITVANVLKGSGATLQRGTAGATITAGMAVYADASDGGKYKPADCTTSAATAAVVGFALHGALDEQPLAIQTAGPITIGGTLTAGTQYVLSVAGAIAPDADLATSDRIVYVGYATSASVLFIDFDYTGVTK